MEERWRREEEERKRREEQRDVGRGEEKYNQHWPRSRRGGKNLTFTLLSLTHTHSFQLSHLPSFSPSFFLALSFSPTRTFTHSPTHQQSFLFLAVHVCVLSLERSLGYEENQSSCVVAKDSISTNGWSKSEICILTVNFPQWCMLMCCSSVSQAACYQCSGSQARSKVSQCHFILSFKHR